MALRKVFFWLHLTSGVVAGPRDPRPVRDRNPSHVREAGDALGRRLSPRARRRCHAPSRRDAPRQGARDAKHPSRVRHAGGGPGRPRDPRLRPRGHALRGSLRRDRPRRGLVPGACVLSVGHRLAPLVERLGRQPCPRQGRDRRGQPGLPVHRDERLLPLVASQLDAAVAACRDLVPGRPARQGSRLQLAQRDRLLDRPCPSSSWCSAGS